MEIGSTSLSPNAARSAADAWLMEITVAKIAIKAMFFIFVLVYFMGMAARNVTLIG